ncbi:MAG TPA: copper homeostasis protein CutC [Candidatus Merdenecus merdavium]|nr:copper homeostasis protein CutC [Candidatus Merdenecus merdavium]
MKDFILEACVDSVESALAAAEAKVTRLELCSNLIVGGTTPSPCLYHEIRKYTDIPIHVLIRPRFGDFCYSDYEYEMIKQEVKMYTELGAEGVVIGILKSDGTLNTEQLKELAELSKGRSLTLHRAFDVCVNPYHALDQAIDLGFDTILTSGQKNVCIEGMDLLKELVTISEDKIDIQIGSGVNAEAIKKLRPATGARAFHMSGKTSIESAMEYRKEGVNMGLPAMSEYEVWRTDVKKLIAARKVLEEI